MNKALIAVLMLCILGSSMAVIDPEVCFTQAAVFTHQVKAFAASAQASPLQIAKLLGSAYDTFEVVNPLIHGCGLDIPLLNKVDGFKPANATSCFNDIEKIANVALELKSINDAKGLNSDFNSILTILPKIQEAFKAFERAKVDCEIVEKQTATLLAANGFDTNIFKCIQDAQVTLKDAKQFVADYKNSTNLTIVQLFDEAEKVYEDLVGLNQDCGVQQLTNFTLPQIKNVDELRTCIKDLSQTVNSIENTFAILKERKFGKLFNATKAVYTAISDDIAECPKKIHLESADILSCFADGLSISSDLKAFVDASKSKNTKDIVIGAYKVLGELAPLAKDCDLNLPIDIPQVNPSDLENCAANTDSLVQSIKKLADDISSKKIWNVVHDVTDSIKALQVIVSACQNQPKLQAGADILGCINGAKSLYENVNALIENSKANNVPQIVVGAYNIVESLQPLINSCGVNFDLHIPVITFPDLNGCVVNTQTLISGVMDIKEDFTSKNYVKIFDDAAVVVKILEEISVICKPTKNLLSDGSNILTCINNSKALYTNISTLINDTKTKAPINKIVVQSYNIIESIQPLVDSCGLKADLHIPVITFPDLNGCVVDTEGLVNTIKAIKDHVQQKKIDEIFTDVALAVNTLKNISNECKPTKNLLSIDVLSCLNEAQKLYKNVETLIQDSKTKAPVNEIVVLSYNIIESLQPLVDSCGIKADLHIPVITFPDLNGCVVDTEGLVNTIKAIKDHIQSKKIDEIFTDVATAVGTLKNISNECKPTKNLLRMNILKCLSNGQQVVKDVKNFVSTKDHSPVNEIVVNAVKIIKELQPFLDSCDLKVDLHVPDIDFNDLNGCVVDGSNIIQDFKSLQKQIETKDYLSIIGTVQSAIAHVKAVTNECQVHKNTLQSSINVNLKCVKNLATVVKDATKLYKNLTNDSMDILSKLLSIQGLLKDIQPLCNDCGVKINIPEIPSDSKVIATVECVSDVAKAVDSVKNLYEDATSINIIGIAKDVKNIYSHVTGAINVCTQINKSSF